MTAYPDQGQAPWGADLKAYIDSVPETTIAELADVATSGSYTDLSDKPTFQSSLSIHRTAPASSWMLNHNLNRFPSVVLLLDDDPETPVVTDTTYVDANTIVLTFPNPVTGWAHLN